MIYKQAPFCAGNDDNIFILNTHENSKRAPHFTLTSEWIHLGNTTNLNQVTVDGVDGYIFEFVFTFHEAHEDNFTLKTATLNNF